ncbi:MAG: AsnC family transcriptional regulator [Candidatus Bathyarchaeia archaeon]
MKKYLERQRGVLALTEQISIIQAKILKELLADGRQTDNEIAKKIGETKDSVKKNLRKMEETGIIGGATIHINYKSFGYKAVAHILINLDSQQEDQLVNYLQKMPEVYSFYNRGVKGNWDVITIIKTLEQLNVIKDQFKRHFSILEMRTAIWTDVKEMNYNLTITNENTKTRDAADNYQVKVQRGSPKSMTLDQVDLKISDKLSENGRVPMETLGREIGISSYTVKRRYEKLKKNGVLKVTIQVNPNKIGYQAMCVFFTVTSHENSFAIIEKISMIPNIISIMKTTGDYDLQIWAMIKDLGQFFSVQEQLGKIQGITKMDTEMWSLEKWEKWPSPRQYISTF